MGVSALPRPNSGPDVAINVGESKVRREDDIDRSWPGCVVRYVKYISVVQRLTFQGGYTALSTKGVASLLSGTLWKALTFPITYILILVLVVTALLQIRYVNRALQRFNSTQVIPIQFVLFTLSVILGSAVLYRDFESATADQVGKFVGGCALTFTGVYLITSGRGDEENDDEEHEADVEEGIHLIDEEQQRDKVEGDMKDETSQIGRGVDSSSIHVNSRRGSSWLSNGYGTLSSFDSTTSSSSRPFTQSDTAPQTPVDENARISALDSASRPPLSTAANTTSAIVPVTSGAQPSTPRPKARQQTSLAGERPSAKTRRSVSRMLPGPFSSPLSSPLSGIVADTRRKGLDPPSKLRHRRSVGLRKARLGLADDEEVEALGDRPSEATGMGGSSVGAQQSESPEQKSRKDKQRSRSLNEAQGSFFNGHRDGKGQQREEDTQHAAT